MYTSKKIKKIIAGEDCSLGTELFKRNHPFKMISYFLQKKMMKFAI